MIPSLVTKRPVVTTLALGLLLVPGIPGGFSVARPSPTYTATCVLRLDLDHPRAREPDPDKLRRTQGCLDGALTFVPQRAEVARLPIIRNQADPVAFLRSVVRPDFDTGPDVMTISVTGADPDELVALLKAVVEAYLDRVEWSGNVDQLKVQLRAHEATHRAQQVVVSRVEAKLKVFYPELAVDPGKVAAVCQDEAWILFQLDKTQKELEIVTGMALGPNEPAGFRETEQKQRLLCHTITQLQSKREFLDNLRGSIEILARQKESLARQRADIFYMEKHPLLRIVQKPAIR